MLKFAKVRKDVCAKYLPTIAEDANKYSCSSTSGGAHSGSLQSWGREKKKLENEEANHGNTPG